MHDRPTDRPTTDLSEPSRRSSDMSNLHSLSASMACLTAEEDPESMQDVSQGL